MNIGIVRKSLCGEVREVAAANIQMSVAIWIPSDAAKNRRS
jgi:hypothetical protein